MAFLASEELDGVEEKHSSQAPCSPSSSPLPLAQTRLQGAITRLRPLGLALANGAVGVHGFQRKLVVFACLQLPVGSPRSCAIQTAQEQAGVLSIRALPQVRHAMGLAFGLGCGVGGRARGLSRSGTEAETKASEPHAPQLAAVALSPSLQLGFSKALPLVKSCLQVLQHLF